jgi:hypothetical protein
MDNTARGRGWTTTCDMFLLWLETARRTGASVTKQSWGLQLPAMGRSFLSIDVHSTFFGPENYDGAADYRIGTFVDNSVNCLCYQNAFPGKWFPLPLE